MNEPPCTPLDKAIDDLIDGLRPWAKRIVGALIIAAIAIAVWIIKEFLL